jgi:hypothetical protein
MTNTIIKELNKKARPDGRVNLKCLNRRAGERDYKNSQLCVQNDKYQTPWLQEKVRCLAEYDNKVYCRVDEALEPLAHTIAGECKELELLEPGAVPRGLDPENQERFRADFSSRDAKVKQRKSDILINLAQLKMEMESIDAALQHHLQRAENVVLKHASAYWSGVLKAAASTDMPSQPDMEIPDIPGKGVYEEHSRNIRKNLSQVLEAYSQKEEV